MGGKQEWIDACFCVRPQLVPEVAANLCFGGHHHNRLYIAASTSIYAMDVGTRGVEL